VRYAIASSPDIRLVDVRSAPSLAVTLVAWQIEAAPSPRLVGAVEVQVTTADRAVHSEIIRAEEPITADLPGDLATAAGRLLWRLATDCLSRVTHPILIGGLRTTDKGRGYTEMKTAPAAAAYDAFQNCSRFSQWCRAESPPTSR
jgi:hypothetical protein